MNEMIKTCQVYLSLSSIPQEGRDIEVILAHGRQGRASRFRLARGDIRMHTDRFRIAEIRRVAPLVFASVPLQRTTGHAAAIETGRNDRDADIVAHVRVDDRTEDHVHIGVSRLTDNGCRLVDLEERHIGSTGDIEEDAACPIDRDVEQFAGDGIFGGFLGLFRRRCLFRLP